MSWMVYTDGGSRGNPGPAGCGAVLISPEGEKKELHKYVGIQTNNYAEYYGMILAFEELVKMGIKSIHLKADSQLMIKQMKGEYRVKNENLKPLYLKAKKLCENFDSVEFEHVKRHLNKEADALANLAMDLAE